MTLNCPDIDYGSTLLDPTLAPDQAECFEQHLESCGVCQARLDQAERCGDDLRKLARQIGDPTTATADPALREVLARLQEAKSPPRSADLEPADLYFLHPSERPDLLGTLGIYEVQEVIGQGGMGVVLKAFEPALHRHVAIKVLAAAVAGSASARRRFAREAQAAAAVCHDHIVTVHAVSEKDGLPYLVMQYVAGESLQARIDRNGPLELLEVVRIGYQTAAGLAAAHAQGLIHRDIKPANLLLENGLARVKITDFGLARLVDDVGLTQDGVVAGTPEYMAPEQARGEPVDHRADLFSLGSVLYVMCTGVPPFRSSSTLAILREVSEQAPTPVGTMSPDVPAWLEGLIDRLLAKNPAERFQSATEVAALLEGYLAHLREPATVPAPLFAATRSEDGETRRLGGKQTGRQGEKKALRRKLPFFFLVSLPPCLLVCLAAWWFAGGAGAGAAGANAKVEYAKEYFHSFKGDDDIPADFDWDGLDPADCVSFEADGARLALPAGHEGKRMGTGLITRFPVQGDFEITMNFKILREPDLANAGQGSAVYLWVDTSTAAINRAMLMRGIDPARGRNFSTWIDLNNMPDHRQIQDSKTAPATAMSGRLRLVRTGSILSQYVAEGSSDEFRLLWNNPLGTDDVRVRIGGFTGGPKAALEAHLSDLRIRAGALPNIPAEESDQVLGKEAALVIVLAAFLAMILALGAWLVLRRRIVKAPAAVPAAEEQAQPESAAEPESISFPCSGCGRIGKAKAEWAGKKAKCPHCGEVTLIPENGTGIVALKDAGRSS